jgi:glycosyltransferase involved in cell wall biosynthesis
VIDSEKLRKELGLQNKFVVFYHGAISKSRGIFKTVEAMKSLAHRFPQIVFFVLGGEGSTLDEIKEYVGRENLGQNVLFHTRVPYGDVPKFIAMSDVCIVPLPWHPYWINQSPLKLLEYLSMQKPVIVSEIPAHRSTVGSSLAAIFLSSVNAKEIADKIEYAYKNRDKLVEWGKEGKEIVQSDYSWESISRNLDQYLTAL